MWPYFFTVSDHCGRTGGRVREDLSHSCTDNSRKPNNPRSMNRGSSFLEKAGKEPCKSGSLKPEIKLQSGCGQGKGYPGWKKGRLRLMHSEKTCKAARNVEFRGPARVGEQELPVGGAAPRG